MATKPSSGLRLKLEERLTCPVCLDHYTNPKTLPCLHSFCHHCLERLPLDKKNETYYLSCPTCRHCIELPEEGIGAFPVAFHLNDLKEMYSLTKKTADLSNPQEATCSDHGKPFELFCETCNTVICVTCQFRDHKHHEYDLITDSYTKHCQKLRECLSPIERKKEALKKVLSAVAEREGEIRKRGEGVVEEIQKMVEEMINVKVQVYDIFLEDTSLVIPFNPYLDKITPVHIITEFEHPCGVAVTDDNHIIITENWSHCVTILDREGKKVKSLGGKGGSGNVKFSSPRDVAITPDKFILVSDNHSIQKISMDGQRKASVGKEGSGPLQFNRPYGIATSPITGQLYIADSNNHRIQVLNPNLTFSHSFGSIGLANGQFQYPHDVAFDSQGLVYVADFGNHRIQKFSPDGKFVGWFGFGPGQLISPNGITIDTAATGLAYVSEWGNNRISVFTSDGVFVSKFGSEGSNNDQFNHPYGLTFNGDGFLYVCDFNNRRLVVY
ncbi:PREDICTED: E3 ubiquitin-protein ligase TRIM71-like [Amphimedon queenslandica]|uniref:RING-type domain-containing protein n=1 Tax=Amphimedon queenslandica TaxID=400682 RepID=A0AAN0JWA5_AMPQE|nr:PREDICTED: E3 ubiquitin-protein ligase TRIM71-like [Amphimedon queenslandica]|eukprot:XP_019861185.1 PREDICTED: E3 ubiquitin-protein ligase TRIM71-like [Amphimedon queenslandica]